MHTDISARCLQVINAGPDITRLPSERVQRHRAALYFRDPIMPGATSTHAALFQERLF